MVNITKGVFITTDPAVREFLIHLDDCKAILNSKFIIQKLDEKHLFIDGSMERELRDQFETLLEKNCPEQFENK
uniref:General transcription and DNA repair factor IIH subunit TFB5 n=1 Tax=Rhabditophanes sp. KR3021 TaxID=114890 RepID=A0AC35TWG5_9BILA